MLSTFPIFFEELLVATATKDNRFANFIDCEQRVVLTLVVIHWYFESSVVASSKTSLVPEAKKCKNSRTRSVTTRKLRKYSITVFTGN
jgi:hypothetical protein